MISISEIEPNPFQPRKCFKENELQSLADSIKEYGLLQPIIVTAGDNGGYYVVAGERRLRAMQILGEKEIPSIVRSTEDLGQLELALVENIQREDLNPIEVAQAYRRLIDEFGLSSKNLSKKTGKSTAVISSMLSLLKLPDEMQQAVIDGNLVYSKARAIALSLGGRPDEEMLALWKEAEEKGMNKQELEIQAARRGRKQSGHHRLDSVFEEKEKELEEIFGTKVRVAYRGGKGHITFRFYSDEELYEAIERFLSLK